MFLIVLNSRSGKKNQCITILLTPFIITGPDVEKVALILCISITSIEFPFQYIRLKFPVKLSYAMTINKS